jgi:hypothetical protein
VSGLIISGQEVEVDGLTIVNKNDNQWAHLDAHDFGSRNGAWVRQIILHTTQGNWPQTLLPGKGPGGSAKSTVTYWQTSPICSGSHIIIDNDGTVACLTDLATDAAYHATVSNRWSIGIEMRQEPTNNGVYEATYDAAEILVPALCKLFGVQFQMPKLMYGGHPFKRMLDGGPDMIGVFGHRNNTEDRGRGDPGEEIWGRMLAAGAERFDFEAREDIDVWKQRQSDLNAAGSSLTVDGQPGPKTIDALKAAGGATGIWALDHKS